jgi:hypothetical protein
MYSQILQINFIQNLKEKNREMKKNFYKSIIFVFLIGFVFLILEGYIVNYEIEVNGKISIGKYVSKDSWGKGETNDFSFNINGLRYKGNGGRAPREFYKNIGKFYKIRYSEKFKGSLDAYFDEEVTDTTIILDAGFTKEDILGTSIIETKEASFKQEVFAIFGIEE